jgi:hypothetical protein
MEDAEQRWTDAQRANVIDFCIRRIGRKTVNNDDLVALANAYSDSDLLRLHELVSEVEGGSAPRDIMCLLLEEDIPLLRVVHNHLYTLTQRKITVEELIRIVVGLRYVNVMTDEDEDCSTLASHIEIARGTFWDKNQVPYQQDDELMLVVQDFPDRLDEIRLYRMDRGYDSGGLRLFLSSASRVLAEGTL